MIRARFKANLEDPRPIHWPIRHPYWISGEGDDYAIVIAYADSVDHIYENWPEAEDVDYNEVEKYTFTDRFPKPDWFKGVES